jgi:hypothetical protein
MATVAVIHSVANKGDTIPATGGNVLSNDTINANQLQQLVLVWTPVGAVAHWH